jgi:hypothetical protein
LLDQEVPVGEEEAAGAIEHAATTTVERRGGNAMAMKLSSRPWWQARAAVQGMELRARERAEGVNEEVGSASGLPNCEMGQQ